MSTITERPGAAVAFAEGGQKRSGTTTEQRILHFELSGDKDYILKGFGGTYSLQAHSSVTRAPYPELQAGAGERVTHFAAVKQPAERGIQLIRIYGPKDADGIPTLESMAVSTPADTGVYTKNDLTKALLFLHPGLTVLTAEHAPPVMSAIENASNFSQMTAVLRSLGSNWNRTTKIKDANGKDVLDARGNPLYEYRLAPEVQNLRASVGQSAKIAANNDQSLRDVRWRVLNGKPSIDISPANTEAGMRTGVGALPGYKYQMQDPGPNYGFSAEVLDLTDDFELKIRLHNSYVRHAGVFVSFLAGDGKTAIAVPEDSWLSLIEADIRDSVGEWIAELKHSINSDDPPIYDNTHLLNFLGTLGAETTFLGVPISSTSSDFSFKLPSGTGPDLELTDDETISKVRILCGSLGHNTDNDWDPAAAWVGIAATLFLDIALPTVALCATAGTVTNKLFDSIFKDVKFIAPTIVKVALAIYDAVKNPDLAGGDVKALLEGLADTIVQKVLSAADVAAKLAGYFGAEEAAEAIPIVGWALKAEAIEADVEQLAQTVGEVIGSTRITEFDIAITLDTRFTLLPDGKGGFPARTQHYTITAQYSGGKSITYTAELPDPKTGQIDVTWENLPVGGKVTFLVAFYSSEGWLIGKGQSATIPNLITPGKGALIVPPITITELLYPLNSNTKYGHQQLLRYQNGKHQWMETNTAPAETVKDLSTGDADHGLDNLTSITLNSDLGILGYSWEASGQDVPLVGQSSPRDEVCYTFQDISFGGDPESGIMFTPAGYNNSPLLVYQRAAGEGAHNPGFFFLDPNPDDAGGYHLRGISPVTDPAVPSNSPRRLFDLSTGMSWGRFHSPLLPTSIALHPNGCVVAVTSGYSKLQILDLPDSPVPSEKAPWAQVLSGPGSREGLVEFPQLVAIAPDQTIFVLEAGNHRIQAFSRGGHPAPAFPKLPTPYWIPLYREPNDSSNVTYTAMSVEIQGHIYVLSYEDTGYDPRQFRLDIYSPDGSHLLRQRGVNTAALTVDLWRNLYTLNYQKLLGPGGRTEPSVSEWVPYTPKALGAVEGAAPGMKVKHPGQPVTVDTWVMANAARGRTCYLRTYYQEWNYGAQRPYDVDGFGAAIFYPWDQGDSPNQWRIVWVNDTQFALQAVDSGKYIGAGSMGWSAPYAYQMGLSHHPADGNDSYSGNGWNGLFSLQNLGGNQVSIRYTGNPYFGRPPVTFDYTVEWQDTWYSVAIVEKDNPGPAETITLIQADPLAVLLLSGSGAGLNLSGRDLSFGGKIVSITGCDFTGANLEGASFAGLADLDLAGCNFTNARLKNVSFGACKNVGQSTWRNADLSGADLSHFVIDPGKPADFSGANLSGATLGGLNMRSAKFAGANLSRAILQNVNFQGADLTGANLTGAFLSGADFTNARLAGVTFDYCDLTLTSFGANPQFGRSTSTRTSFRSATINAPSLGNDWSYLDLTGAALKAIPQDLSGLRAQYTLFPTSVDLHGVKLPQAHLENAQMYYADLHESDLSGAFLDGTLLKGARLNGANLNGASMKGAWLIAETGVITPNKYEAAQASDAFLINTCLDGARCNGVDFSGAMLVTYTPLSLTPASANGAFMNSAKFNDAVLIGANFRGAQLAGADFSGATLIASQFPSAQLTPTSDSNRTVASLYKADIRGTQFADIDHSGRITNPANMDGTNMHFATFSKTTGQFEKTYQNYDGTAVPLVVDYGPTVLGTTTSSTRCPGGGNGPCSL
jgi:uncharacterized protein YjbI with pentapeptide repeats